MWVIDMDEEHIYIYNRLLISSLFHSRTRWSTMN